MASQITSLTILYPIAYSGADQRKHQSSALIAFVQGIHRWPLNTPHKGPVTWKIFPFDDVIIATLHRNTNHVHNVWGILPQMFIHIAKTLGSISVRHRSNTFASDRYQMCMTTIHLHKQSEDALQKNRSMQQVLVWLYQIKRSISFIANQLDIGLQ